jgi:hypothetical protein
VTIKRSRLAKGDYDLAKKNDDFTTWLKNSVPARIAVLFVFVSPLAYLAVANQLTFSPAENILLSAYLVALVCFFGCAGKLMQDYSELRSYRFNDLKRWEGWTHSKFWYVVNNHAHESIKRMAKEVGHSEASVRRLLVSNKIYESYLRARVRQGGIAYFEAKEITEKTGIKVPWSEEDDPEAFVEYQSPIRVEWPLIDALIKTRNDHRLEFVAAAFNDKQTERADEITKHEFLMHVAAFLNTAGGQVIIGVREDGGIFGLKKDGYNAGYSYTKRLEKLIQKTLGEAVLNYIDIRCVDAIYVNKNHRNRGKQICLVTCKKTPDTVQCVNRKYNLMNGLDTLEPITYFRVGSTTRASRVKKDPYLKSV